MDSINIGLGSPEHPFDFELEKQAIEKAISEAIAKGGIPPHLDKLNNSKTTVSRSGRKLSARELEDLERYDEYIEGIFQSGEWNPCVLMLRDRLASLPPRYDTYKMLLVAEEKCGALDLAAKHAQEAYRWDPLFPEAYMVMVKLDLVAMQPERAEAWLSFIYMIPGYKEEVGDEVQVLIDKIQELYDSTDKLLAKVTHLFTIPDFWVKLARNVEYYRTFASDETRELVKLIQKDPSSLRKYLGNDKIHWLASMLSWTSAPLTYEPPTVEQLSLRQAMKDEAAKDSQMMALPFEMLIEIMDHLDPPSLGRLPQVSKFWRDLLKNDHRVWKRLYLNLWDPPIIYHVPEWLWIHAFRQRYGLCMTMSRIWNRRDGDYNPQNPNYAKNVRHFLGMFSFISPSFPDSLSLIPDFIYGNSKHNILTLTKFKIHEVETTEEWPAEKQEVKQVQNTAQTPKKDRSLLSEDDFITTYLRTNHVECALASDNLAVSARIPAPLINSRRRTLKKAIPVFETDPNQSWFDSDVINVCYFLLLKSDFKDDSLHAAKALATLAFHDASLAQHLIQIGAIERAAFFGSRDGYSEIADFLATLLLHKHGIVKECSTSAQTAVKIFPRLWALNVLQDLKDVQYWVSGLSGVWRGRFFLGTPGYDTAFVEHFLYLDFDPNINFGHFIPQKDLDQIQSDFEKNHKRKKPYKFTSKGYISQSTSNEEEAEEADVFEGNQVTHEGECKITGWGIDDFGHYKVFGRLNIVYRTIFFIKKYEHENIESQLVYCGGDLGIWGPGGMLRHSSTKFGYWKLWKDPNNYDIEELHNMRIDAQNSMILSVRERRSRAALRRRLWTKTLKQIVLRPQIFGNDQDNSDDDNDDNDDGDDENNQPLPQLNLNQNNQNDPQAQGDNARKGLRWTEIDFPIIDVLVDPVPAPPGPHIPGQPDITAVRGKYYGYKPQGTDSNGLSPDDEHYVWFEPDIGYGPQLAPILDPSDENKRVQQLMEKPVSKRLSSDVELPLAAEAFHPNLLTSIITLSEILFQLEHLTESVHHLAEIEAAALAIPPTKRFSDTLPIPRFEGEPTDKYIRRRSLFTSCSRLISTYRKSFHELHKEAALRDAAILRDEQIPWNDPLKIQITHRWIDEWWRHPIRFVITDQAQLQSLLAEVLVSSDYSLLDRHLLRPETEPELLQQESMKQGKSPSKLRSPGKKSETNNFGPTNEQASSSQSWSGTQATEQSEQTEDSLNKEDAAQPSSSNTQTPPIAAASSSSWLQSTVAWAAVGIVVAIGFGFLATTLNKKP